ncbi:hypothetical protein ACFQ07_13335, partial [Actinomadura adrarensis]
MLGHRDAVLGDSGAFVTGGPVAAANRPPQVLAGIVLDATPHLLVLDAGGTEVRVPMTEATTVWHGGSGG